ncbi:MAG: hypothetical protein ACF8LK_02505 [Phycisphaerales bacterium JB041]
MGTALRIVLLVSLAGTGVARGGVTLHSTLGIVNAQSYNRMDPDFDGGIGRYGFYQNAESADDFTLATTAKLDSVTLDYLVVSSQMPAQGVQLNLWTDAGGSPDALVYAGLIAPNHVIGAAFTDTVFGLTGLRLTADTTNQAIVLGPGTYWVTMKPVDTTNAGEAYFSVRDSNLVNGAATVGRDIVGSLYGSNAWFTLPFPGSGGTTSMEIVGTLVPAPGSLALLGAVFGVRRRGR